MFALIFFFRYLTILLQMVSEVETSVMSTFPYLCPSSYLKVLSNDARKYMFTYTQSGVYISIVHYRFLEYSRLFENVLIIN